MVTWNKCTPKSVQNTVHPKGVGAGGCKPYCMQDLYAQMKILSPAVMLSLENAQNDTESPCLV